jgi:hypothetical protein
MVNFHLSAQYLILVGYPSSEQYSGRPTGTPALQITNTKWKGDEGLAKEFGSYQWRKQIPNPNPHNSQVSRGTPPPHNFTCSLYRNLKSYNILGLIGPDNIVTFHDYFYHFSF